jgi:YfiH family protein
MTPLTHPLLTAFPHGWFGRVGGVSTGLYATLNAGPGSNDDPAAVAENRRRIAAHFGQGPDRLLSAHQIHSALAVVVDGPWHGPRPQVDALVTAMPNLVLSVLTADCAPVLLADQEAGVVACAHAGWKGALGGVLQATIATMETMGAAPARMAAVVGPSIQQASYEVGPEFEAQFLAADGANARFFEAGAGDRRRFDLPAYCVTQLQQAGVNASVALPDDTYAGATRWHSHRRSVHESLSDYGRNCAAIMIAGG